MSHRPGVIRTTRSSNGIFGVGAPPPGPAPVPGPSEVMLARGYPATYPALLKVAQMISLLIAFICVKNSLWTDYSAYGYFEVVIMCDLLIFYLVHLFCIYRVFTCISWPLAELLHYLIGTILLLIASIVAASKSYRMEGLIARAVFGFFLVHSEHLVILQDLMYKPGHSCNCVMVSLGMPYSPWMEEPPWDPRGGQRA